MFPVGLDDLLDIKENIMKKKPTGFIVECQCGEIVGALDYGRIDRREADFLLRKWLRDGCMLKSVFDASWSVEIGLCKCVI